MKKYLSALFVLVATLLVLASTAFAATDYTITNIRLTDLKGNSIEYTEGSCMVNVTVTKNNDVADGYVVISSYTEDETLIGFNYLFTSLDAGKSATLGALVSPPADTKIGKVKAMVWDSLDGMTPLAASKILVPGEEVEEEKICNLAIVERYVDINRAGNFGSEYAYLDVVTLTGESKRLEIDPVVEATVSDIMESAGIGYSVTQNANSVPLKDRIIEYKIKTSTKRVNNVLLCTDVTAFTSRYDSVNNKLANQALAENASVLDATNYDTAAPQAEDYKAVPLKNLSEKVDYEGVLVSKNDSDEYEYIIITSAGATYYADSDFAVVAANANTDNKAIFDGEEVYFLRVMDNGNSDARNMHIAYYANVYVNGVGGSYSSNVSYLKEGAVFYYTTDSYGLVDRIDVVVEGGYDYDTLTSLITEEYDAVTPTLWKMISLPDSAEISQMTWFVDVDKDDIEGLYEEIQLFIAPVVSATSSSVTFGAVEGNDTDGLYINTNNKYLFSVANDANIYAYEIAEAGRGYRAFSGGEFYGIDINYTDADGRAWLTNVPANEKDFDELVQFAFVMAVDGEITNALLFNP